MKKSKQIFVGCAVVVTLLLTSYPAEAKEVLRESGSYVGADGCIYITYKVEHHFLGINWYTEKDELPIPVVCP